MIVFIYINITKKKKTQFRKKFVDSLLQKIRETISDEFDRSYCKMQQLPHVVAGFTSTP